jgi:hypothetical protein
MPAMCSGNPNLFSLGFFAIYIMPISAKASFIHVFDWVKTWVFRNLLKPIYGF